jgi:4-hydroxyproline epimerase
MLPQSDLPHEIEVIDSHTGGEPTRVIVSGGPDLGSGSLAQRRDRFRTEFDHFRTAVINEPRGSDVVVGALLCQPTEPKCIAGTIFFNNAGYLGMCGHGTIGLMVTLLHLGRIEPGRHYLETPVGIVMTDVHDRETVTVQNVPSYRWAADVSLEVPGLGRFTGDIAWGGNWFFLVKDHEEQVEFGNLERLLDVSRRIQRALLDQGIRGPAGEELDHVELFGPSRPDKADSRNFVLCPGGAYDRSPCGTGTSAKLACLAAAGELKPGQVWRQESVIGSLFEASYELAGEAILPSITGRAWVCGAGKLLFHPRDPFRQGIR